MKKEKELSNYTVNDHFSPDPSFSFGLFQGLQITIGSTCLEHLKQDKNICFTQSRLSISEIVMNTCFANLVCIGSMERLMMT